MRVREGERHLLHRRRSRFADVIAADRDRVPVRQLALAVGEDVGDDAQRLTRRVDIGAARHVLLEDVVLHRAGDAARGHALALRDRDVEREQDDRGRVDGHRRRHLVERDTVEQRRHVFDRVDRDADPAHFAGGERMVRVVSHLRRQIEGDAQAVDALREQIPITLVRFGRRGEAGVLAHRPQASAIHRRLDAAGERKLAREADVGGGAAPREVLRRAHGRGRVRPRSVDGLAHRARLYCGGFGGRLARPFSAPGQVPRRFARRAHRASEATAEFLYSRKSLTVWRLGLKLNMPARYLFYVRPIDHVTRPVRVYRPGVGRLRSGSATGPRGCRRRREADGRRREPVRTRTG